MSWKKYLLCSEFSWLSKEGKGWLIDFGMATPLPDFRLPDRRGTRGFRAPEVLRGSKVQTSGSWTRSWNNSFTHFIMQRSTFGVLELSSWHYCAVIKLINASQLLCLTKPHPKRLVNILDKITREVCQVWTCGVEIIFILYLFRAGALICSMEGFYQGVSFT